MTVLIVSAAIKRAGLIFSAPPPARHHTLMHDVDRYFGDSHAPFLPDEQGFLGSDGNFYSRSEAMYVAVTGGQITAGKFGGAELYSEDLW